MPMQNLKGYSDGIFIEIKIKMYTYSIHHFLIFLFFGFMGVELINQLYALLPSKIFIFIKFESFPIYPPHVFADQNSV